MHAKYLWGALIATFLCAAAADTRIVNVKLAAEDEVDDDAVAQPSTIDEEQQPQFKPVLIARRPLQHRPLAAAESERQQVAVVRQSPRVLQQRQREQEDEEEEQQIPQQVVIRQQPAKSSVQHQQRGQQLPAQQLLIQQRVNKDQQQQQQQKEPTAQTIKNYNKVNDDGSFTFGYEADDGSFKEETRGTDCVVRGKYGYVDPDGNKREFSYVQGNPCDPNAVSAEDEEDQNKPGQPAEEENIPANVPRPKPKKNRPTTTLFQQTFGDFEQPQPHVQSTTPRQPGRQQQPFQEIAPRRPASPPPQVQAFQPDSSPSTTAAPALSFRPSAAPENLESALRNLPQPPSGKSQLQPAGPNNPLYTTELVFDPATGQYNTVIYQQVPKQPAGININQRLPLAPASTRQPQPQFQPHSPPQFQPQPQPQFKPQPQPQFRPSVQPFQPQFQAQQRPVEFDFQPRPGQFSPSPQQQQLVQQQQALTFQQSQNLFRQQQLQKQQQQQQPFQPQSTQFFPPPPSQRFSSDPSSQFAPLPKQQRFEPQPEAHQQKFVLVQPGRTPGQQHLAAGQIDAFLRGHNVQF